MFRRAPDYDTGDDHVVRSRAAEVRKRLALYYQETGHTDAVRISVPSGSYRAVFEIPSRGTEVAAEPPAQAPMIQTVTVLANVPEPRVQRLANRAAEEPAPVRHSVQLNIWRGVAVLAVLACVILAAYPRRHAVPQSAPFTKFWAPLLSNPKPALIYCGGGFVYKLSDTYLDSYKQRHGIMDDRYELFVNLKPDDTVRGTDLLPDKQLVPFGDLATTARVTSMLTE